MSTSCRAALLALLLAVVSAPALGAVAFDKTKFRGLPSIACADIRTANICADQRASLKPSHAQAARSPFVDLPVGARVPLIVCDLPTADGPCTVRQCGDGICAFGEVGQCAEDCPLPAKLDICVCDKAPCVGYAIECNEAGCTSARKTPTAAECTCAAANGSQTCAPDETGKTHCRAVKFFQPIETCELTRVQHETGGETDVYRCSDLDCAPPEGMSLRQTYREVIEKTAIGSAK